MHAARWICCAIVLMGSLGGCGRRENPLPKDVSSALTMAYNKDDAAACTDLYASDGAILPQNEPTVIGRGAILKLFQNRMAPALQYATDSTVSGANGDLAFDQGTYVIRNVEQGRDMEFGKYINIFKKENGHWKIFRTMWNRDTPTPGASPIRPLPPVPNTKAAPAPAPSAPAPSAPAQNSGGGSGGGQ